jgi:hypothetical protein
MARPAAGGLAALTALLLACGAIPLPLETPSPTPAARGVAFAPQLCLEYDQYQASGLAFLTISRLASFEADRDTRSSGDATDARLRTIERFVEEVRRLERGERPDPSDPTSEFAALWVSSGGCIGGP